MKQVLVYSDSLSWGIIPDTRDRLPFHERWPGVAEDTLIEKGMPVRVIENCLNGRRTAWDDPFKPGRNGLLGIEQVIEMHSPLALAVVMLGTNDFQSMHTNNAWHSSQGIASIIKAIRQAPIEPGMPVPEILLVTPPLIRKPGGTIAAKFTDAEIKYSGLEEAYRTVATELDCHYLDSGSIIETSSIDGIHIDADQHKVLGIHIAENIYSIIN